MTTLGTEITKSSNPSQRIVAIAYDWVLAPIDFSDFDVVLNIGRSDSADKKTPLAVTTYRAHLPGRKTAPTQSDVSGNLGLVFAVSNDSAEKRAVASERLIADAIIWELSKLAFSDAQTTILIQGPMLPKVRGRLLYRALPQHIKVWGVTWQPEWFWRLEASQQLLRNIEAQQNDDGAAVSPMYPPRGIDRASRSWVCKRAEKVVYHFELLANTWDSLETPEWEKVVAEDIPRFAGSPAPGSTIPYLPEAMRAVGDAVKEKSELEKCFLWFLPQLREVDHQPELCATKNSRLYKTLEFLDPSLSSPVLFGGTTNLNWKDENAVYTAFTSNPKKVLSLLREPAGLSV